MTKGTFLGAGLALYLSILPVGVIAQEVHTGEGPLMKTLLLGSVYLNEESSLRREWTIVNDEGLPARIVPDGFSGIQVSYQERSFEYSAIFDVVVETPLTAIKVIFVTFDVWNDRVKNLASTDIQDLDEGDHFFSSRWRILSENEAASHFATLAYVDQVRTADGRIIRADRSAILEQAQRISAGFTEDDLSTDN